MPPLYNKHKKAIYKSSTYIVSNVKDLANNCEISSHTIYGTLERREKERFVELYIIANIFGKSSILRPIIFRIKYLFMV